MDLLGQFERVKGDQFTFTHDNKPTGNFIAVQCNEEESKLVYDGVSHNYSIAHVFRAFADNKYSVTHDVSGCISLSKFLETHYSRLVYQIQSPSKSIMSDTFKRIVRDLFLVVILAEKSKIKLKMSLDDIFIRKGKFPRLEAIAQGTCAEGDTWKVVHDEQGKEIKLCVWGALDRVLLDMLTKCNLDKDNNDVKLMRDGLKSGLLPRERMRRLHTYPFWTTKIKIGVLYVVGEMVEVSHQFGNKDTTQTLKGWRGLVSADRLLKDIEESFTKDEKKKAKNLPLTDEAKAESEARSFLFFIRWTMLHFEAMKQTIAKEKHTVQKQTVITTAFPDRISLFLYYEMTIPKLMDGVYKAGQDFLAKSFRFF